MSNPLGLKPAQARPLVNGACIRTDLKLLEVEQDLLEEIMSTGGRARAPHPGQADNEAVMCTGNKTYALKYVETTNSQLLVQPLECQASFHIGPTYARVLAQSRHLALSQCAAAIAAPAAAAAAATNVSGAAITAAAAAAVATVSGAVIAAAAAAAAAATAEMGPQLCFYSTGAPDAAEQGESDFQQGSTSPTMITLTSPPYQLCVELHKSPLPLYVRFHLPLPTARWASHVPLAI
eukprot:1011398-Pelagomonas_calceolata.AAC.1